MRTSIGRAWRKSVAAIRGLHDGAWISLIAALACTVVATALYFDVPHRLFPDSMTITVTSKGESARYHLCCKPTTGNLPHAAAACQAMR
jgi:hypothetical protein